MLVNRIAHRRAHLGDFLLEALDALAQIRQLVAPLGRGYRRGPCSLILAAGLRLGLLLAVLE